MTQEEYVRLNALDAPRSWRTRLQLLAAALVGFIMLFSPYSVNMGVLVIALAAFLLALPRLTRYRLRRKFAETRYLQGPVTYGVSTRGFWLAGRHLNAESTWAGLATWQERHGWLVLAAGGMPRVYLPLDDLRASGVREEVLALARAHAPEAGAAPGRAKGRAPARS